MESQIYGISGEFFLTVAALTASNIYLIFYFKMDSKLRVCCLLASVMIWMIPYNFVEGTYVGFTVGGPDHRCYKCSDYCEGGDPTFPDAGNRNTPIKYCSWNTTEPPENTENEAHKHINYKGTVIHVCFLVMCLFTTTVLVTVCSLQVALRHRKYPIYNTKCDVCEKADPTSWNVTSSFKTCPSGDPDADMTCMQTKKSSNEQHGGKTIQVNSQQNSLRPAESNARSAELSELNRIVEDIQELKERMGCKICLSAKMSIVLLPCSHMVACQRCSMLLDRCPVCRTRVKGTLPVHTRF